MTSKHVWLMSIGLCTWASIAHAHISITDGGTHVGRSEDMKTDPCGGPEARGSGMIYTYKPGETINITIKETISHPGYFRIAFDDDGDDGFVTPSGTIGEMGDCGLVTDACGPGKEDYCNNETVLLDHLNLHAAAPFGTTKDWTFSVTLPNVECANCTLQIIQMMNDLGIHGPTYPDSDIYYQCIDLVLSPSAPDVNDTPVANEGMVCAGGGMAGAGGMGGMGGAGGMGGMAGGAAGMAGMGGMSGTTGGAATSGGGAGMPGMAGMTGTAGMLAAAGAGGAGGGAAGAPAGAGTTAVPPTTGQPSSNGGGGGGGGCNAAGNAGFGGVGTLGLSLLALAARRRRVRS